MISRGESVSVGVNVGVNVVVNVSEGVRVAVLVNVGVRVAVLVNVGVRVAVLVNVEVCVGVAGATTPHEATKRDRMHKRLKAHLVFTLESLLSYTLRVSGLTGASLAGRLLLPTSFA